MPEHEFELYLSLLAKMLRLDAGQRGEITDEMRDHLEERFAELTGQGRSRDDAIRIALDEFGDAAAMAADFTHISRRKRRRLLMRLTVGSVIATTLGILLASAFWPENPVAPSLPQASAQKPQPALAGTMRTAPRHPETEIERKLATKLAKVVWDDVAWTALLLEISKQIEADIVIDKKFFAEQNIDPAQKISLVLNHSKITARTALEMILERLDAADSAITFRDGLIYLTGREHDRQTVVYNCRDLLQAASITRAENARRPVNGGPGGGEGFGGGGAGGADHGGMGFGPGGAPRGAAVRRPIPAHRTASAQALIDVIQSTVRSTPWHDLDGEGATISVFNGLAVISANHAAHRDVKQLLEMLRTASSQPVGPKQPGPRRIPMDSGGDMGSGHGGPRRSAGGLGRGLPGN